METIMGTSRFAGVALATCAVLGAVSVSTPAQATVTNPCNSSNTYSSSITFDITNLSTVGDSTNLCFDTYQPSTSSNPATAILTQTGGESLSSTFTLTIFESPTGTGQITGVPTPADLVFVGGPGLYGINFLLTADQPDTYQVVFTDPPAATPLPAAFPLFATGLGAMGLLAWRRKRKAQADCAAV